MHPVCLPVLLTANCQQIRQRRKAETIRPANSPSGCGAPPLRVGGRSPRMTRQTGRAVRACRWLSGGTGAPRDRRRVGTKLAKN
jgi:hypothetical protein